MPASLQTVSDITKEIYEGSLAKQLNDDTVTLKRIERTAEGTGQDFGGKYVVFPIHTRRNQGIGARNELEALPTPGQQSTKAARVGLKYLYGGVELSGQTFELVDSNRQAFISALDLEMDGLKRDLQKDLNRMVYGDGTGAIAKATAATTSQNTFTAGTLLWVQDGMQVDVIDGTTLNNATPTVKASNRQITAINETTKVLTLDGGTFSVAVGDIIVRTGSVKREWNGLQALVGTGILHNIDPATTPVWKSEIDSGGGTNRALSEGMMITMVDRIRKRGGKVTAIFQNLGVRRAYFNLLVQQRQFTNTKSFDGGFSGLGFVTDTGEIPVVVDVDAPENTQYFLNEKELKWYREHDFKFMDRDGGMWVRKQGFDAYSATMYQYSELGTHRRNTHGRIEDITEG